MMKLKWEWLADDLLEDMSESWMARIGAAPIGFLFSFIGCWIVQGAFLGTAGPDAITWIIVWFCTLGLPILITKLPSFHYLHGVSGRTRDALDWYGGLTADERNQLPKDWDDIVRKHGEMTVPHDEDYIFRKTVAGEMLDAARMVVRLYNESQQVLDKKPELDYRVPVQLQLMAERAEDLKQAIDQKKEIEAKIARMP